ncbi:unnamed protein product [Arctogadus glacialis]
MIHFRLRPPPSISITRLVEEKLQQIDGQSSGRLLLVELGSAALHNVGLTPFLTTESYEDDGSSAGLCSGTSQTSRSLKGEVNNCSGVPPLF